MDTVNEVRKFMRIGRQSVDRLNPEQATLYVGLILEEVAEMVEVIGSNAVESQTRDYFTDLRNTVSAAATLFKNGEFRGCLMRANQNDGEALLDSLIDTMWVSTGAALSLCNDTDKAFAEVARSNNAKFPGGVCTKDANGKIVKPADWTAPDLIKFITKID